MFSSSNSLHSTSSTSSSPRNTSRSLLNPTSPRKSPIVLPASTEKKDMSRPLQIHRRGRSTSDLLRQYERAGSPLVRVTSTSGLPTSLPASNGFGMTSTFRDRSRSGSPGSQTTRELRPQSSDHTLNASWWSSETHVTKPWHNSPKKKGTVPPEGPEQAQALHSTRTKVAQAVVSALGTAADVTHEALCIGVDLLEFAPVPGLKPAAKILLDIWDASQMVDMNRLSCLRLTERCADILISVREEIFDAGDVLGQELAAPIGKLEESFEAVYNFLMKQNNRPFLKKYLRRDETLRDISACDSSLRDALELFGISIQIRILKQVHEGEQRRQVDSKAFFEAIINGRVPPSPSALDSNIIVQDTKPKSNHEQSEIVTHSTATENALGLFEDAHHLSSSAPQDLTPSQITSTLTSLHSLQNSLDTAMDTADLRQLMRAALQTTSDAHMLEVLGIGHQEMPDAIKTLQRALERVTEREAEGMEASPLVVAKQVSLKEAEEPDGSRKRSRTVISIDSTSSIDSTRTQGHSSNRKDTLDREFIESGIDALRRMTRGAETSVPSWTITKYEVDHDEKIGIGFFSDVYKGTWRGRTVAIKVLAESTPRKLFVHEVEIWKTLRHPNVLPLYGASSTSGDPPWFFVSGYMKNGNIVEHLKRIESEKRPSNLGVGVGSTQRPLSPMRRSETGLGSGIPPSSWTVVRGTSPTRRDLTPPGSRARSPTPDDTAIHREWDLFRFMHEIAKGMEYLHSREVLHGDLKGANVLVDDQYRCVISDFGQSKMKLEACRLSGTPLTHGTLRWQSPELMAGSQSQLSQESDVWAFSICCVEILTMGRLPWPLNNDDSVRHFVLKDDGRPPLPDNSRFNTQGLQDILKACWTTKPTQRPTFVKLVKDFKQLRNAGGQEIADSPSVSVIDEPEIAHSPSPDMRPTSCPEYHQYPDDDLSDISPALGTTIQPSRRSTGSGMPRRESVVSTGDRKIPEVVIYTPVSPDRSSSFNAPVSPPVSPPEEHPNMFDLGECEAPPADERIAKIQNERRYRLLLTHDYHPSLTLPLWDPSPVQVGAVGYLSKPQGRFVTLFNALTPDKATHAAVKSLPSILGYGPAQLGIHRQDRRSVTQKGMDAISGLLTFRTSSEKLSRRYSYPLKAGHQIAYFCTETTDYRYLEQLDAAKKWFQTHVDFIMETYRDQHHIQKEDLFLVIGSLSAPNYALFVSHCHPEGQAHFSVYATPRKGQPWGAFTTDTQVSEEQVGPSYDESTDINPVQSIKVSNHGGPWNAVLLARLRFKPDVLEPTSK